MEGGVRKEVEMMPEEYSGRKCEKKKSGRGSWRVNIMLSMGRYLDNTEKEK